MESIGKILVRYIPKEMKRKSLADILGVKQQYLSNILNDKKLPSDKFLENFTNVFGVKSKDLEKISKYAMYIRTPESIRDEVLEIKENFSEYATKTLSYIGYFDDNGFNKTDEKEVITGKGNIFKMLKEGDFVIDLRTDKYPPFFNGDILLFKKPLIQIEANSKYCLAEFEGIISIYQIKLIDSKMILLAINKDDSDKIVTSRKKIKILGYMCANISKGE